MGVQSAAARRRKGRVFEATGEKVPPEKAGRREAAAKSRRDRPSVRGESMFASVVLLEKPGGAGAPANRLLGGRGSDIQDLGQALDRGDA